MPLKIGDPAPEFALFDSDKNKISLSDYKGKNILLLFYPQAFTHICTEDLCDIRDNIQYYNTPTTEVFAISVDSVFTLNKFKQEQQYNFLLLSDFNKEVSSKYGCLYETWILDMKGVCKRSAFIIDQAGILRYKEILENANEHINLTGINQILTQMA